MELAHLNNFNNSYIIKNIFNIIVLFNQFVLFYLFIGTSPQTSVVVNYYGGGGMRNASPKKRARVCFHLCIIRWLGSTGGFFFARERAEVIQALPFSPLGLYICSFLHFKHEPEHNPPILASFIQYTIIGQHC